MVDAAFKAVRSVLVTASKCKQPSAAVLQSLLQPISAQISAVQDFREKNRRSNLFNHLSAISESIPALGWVSIVSCVSCGPRDFLLFLLVQCFVRLEIVWC